MTTQTARTATPVTPAPRSIIETTGFARYADGAARSSRTRPPVPCLQNSCSTTELRRPALGQSTRPVVNSAGGRRELTGSAVGIQREPIETTGLDGPCHRQPRHADRVAPSQAE